MTLLRQLIIHKFISFVAILSLAACSFSLQRPISHTTVGSSQTFYVDGQKGLDTNPGTSRERPWRTIQKAADSVRPGDTITVLPGSYAERVNINQGGAEGAPVVFQAEGSVTTNGFTIQAHYVTLRGFTITNTPDDVREGWGVYVTNHDCVIENNTITSATRGGVLLSAVPGAETNTANCIIRNNRLSRNAMVGIEVNGRNHLVENNDISGTIQYHPAWKNPPVYVDADGIRFFGSGHTIRGNTIHDIRYGIPENVNPHIDCFQTWAGQDRESASNILFEQNFCDNDQIQASNQAGQGFMLDGANNLTIRNNVIKAFRLVNAVNCLNLNIINNALVSDPHLSTPDGPTGIGLSNTRYATIINNIFYGISGPIIYTRDTSSQNSLETSNNLVFVQAGIKPTGNPAPGDIWNVDPLFVNPAANDFHLQVESPAIDAGTEIPSLTVDMDGNPRPQGKTIDIGAYETQQYRSLIPLIDQIHRQQGRAVMP